jgi:membrane protease YdiL (CAAX protease family)
MNIMLASISERVREIGIRKSVGAATSDIFVQILVESVVIAMLGGPLGEEFGWRGYALPALTTRIGWRAAGALIGIAWALWHLPLLFMADTAQADLPIALFLISTVGLSVVMARLGVHTRFSVLPALLLHSVINWWSMIVPIDADGQAYALVAVIATLVSVIACLAPGPRVKLQC